MAEWPRTLAEPKHPTALYEVIPADLGRELYEALRREVNGWTGPDTPSPRLVLARYEREVGE